MESPAKKKIRISPPGKEEGIRNAGVFDGLEIYIVEQALGKTRCNIFKEQLKKHGATITTAVTSKTHYLLVAKEMKQQRLLKILKCQSLPENLKVVSVEWLSSCLMSGKRESILPYQMFSETLKNKTTKDVAKEHTNLEASNKGHMEVPKLKTSYEELLEIKEKEFEENFEDTNERNSKSTTEKSSATGVGNCLPGSTKMAGNWVCARPSAEKKDTNHNKHITEKLEVLQKTYENTKDKWRAMSYKKAITSIKNHGRALTTFEEVKNLPFVGDRLAKKIWEIIETGHLRRLDHIDEHTELINVFAGVWGAGPTTAMTWVAQGYRSLDELKEKADLTFQQKIGIKYYDDINEKMPREEVAEIEKHIRPIAERLLPGVKMEICGSYRRGRPRCGDIDVLFSHRDDNQRKSFLMLVLDELKKIGLITDDLICVESKEQCKYMGVCKLPIEGSKYRRIDFIVAPFNEWPLALMHFTGSAHFNRSIRLLAKKKNMSLSEHALRENVIRIGGDKINEGNVVPMSSEEDIFKYFGLNYLKPTERDW